MSIKKNKWVVTWWDDEKDKLAKRTFETHEQAITHSFVIKNKYNRHSTIKLKGI